MSSTAIRLVIMMTGYFLMKYVHITEALKWVKTTFWLGYVDIRVAQQYNTHLRFLKK
jgi:hypothetical protein